MVDDSETRSNGVADSDLIISAGAIAGTLVIVIVALQLGRRRLWSHGSEARSLAPSESQSALDDPLCTPGDRWRTKGDQPTELEGDHSGRSSPATPEGLRLIELLKQELAFRQEVGDLAGEQRTLENLAPLCLALGRLNPSIDYFERLLAIYFVIRVSMPKQSTY